MPHDLTSPRNTCGARLRIRCRKAWGFESPSRNHEPRPIELAIDALDWIAHAGQSPKERSGDDAERERRWAALAVAQNDSAGPTRRSRVVGFTLLLAGIVMLVTPGPGWLVILFGLSALAAEFVWARRLLDRLKKRGAALGHRIFGKRKSLAE